MAQRITTIDDDEIRDVYEWIDHFPLSRIKRNFARDFSDAVLINEILKVFYPSLVVLNSIVQAHNRKDKISNWDYLRSKLIRKNFPQS